MKRFMLLFITLTAGFYIHAQQAHYSEKDYARNPVWIQMIEDEHINYFEAEKAYKIYWQHHDSPGSEHDVIGEHAQREKIPSKRQQKKIRQDDNMRMEVKKYQRWHERVLPYVQKDGTNLSKQEQLDIWLQQKNKK